jgi:hypothetical protein
MNRSEFLIDWLDTVTEQISRELDGLSAEQLAWQPDERANSIAVTAWHCARWFDLTATQVLEGKPQSDELWYQAGWAARTGYDPTGIGFGGLGAITGYTWDEVLAIPALESQQYGDYLRTASARLAVALQQAGPGGLEAPAKLGQGDPAHVWVKRVLIGITAHLGEIRTLKGIQERAST